MSEEPHRRCTDSHRRAEDRERDLLERRVGDLAVGVVGLRGALESVGTILRHDVEALRHEVETTRRLGKYARRTHFQVMYWVALFAIQVSGLAVYLRPTVPELSATLFWLVPLESGAFWEWRIFGALLQIIGLAVLWHRAQVPDDLFDRVASGSTGRRSLYNRVLGRVS